MNAENARRLAERQERDRLRISLADVEAYRRVHYPDRRENTRVARIPGDEYVAKLPHDEFHEWFGTVCDDTCPHPRPIPSAQLKQAPWWKRLFARRS